jgi:UDP-N-acetylglucosamine 1-carboxyvinyltransferase
MGNYTINGGRKLSGSIKIESAKNAVLPILSASLLCSGEVIIQNCPKIGDVLSMIKILNYLGVSTKFQDDNLVIDNSNFKNRQIPKNLASEMRSSIFLLGPILALDNKVKLAYPGGCNIGQRPIDIHISSLKRLGATIKEYSNGIWAESPNGIVGDRIILSFPSVGATENAIMASVFCKGKTIINNCAREPEVIDLANFINSCGGLVSGAGTNRIEITGVKKLYGTIYKPISDRIELGTYMISSVITDGEGEFKNANIQNIPVLAHKFLNNTCRITVKNDIIYVKSEGLKKAYSFETGPFPKFSTDFQAQAMALLTVSEGTSIIRENLYENRFAHAEQLNLMGANVSVYGNVAEVKGVARLHGAKVVANDLRGGSALVLAGLCAEGQTVVEGVSHIKRGYLDMCEKLKSLGADIKEN